MQEGCGNEPVEDAYEAGLRERTARALEKWEELLYGEREGVMDPEWESWRASFPCLRVRGRSCLKLPVPDSWGRDEPREEEILAEDGAGSRESMEALVLGAIDELLRS